MERRTWDLETYRKKAEERKNREEEQRLQKGAPLQQDAQREEFVPATQGAAGPAKSERAFLKARKRDLSLDEKVGTSEMVSVEEAAATSTARNPVVKTGVGWHCKVCDCFLKDSHSYLNHINGWKHQKALGYSMRVERSTKDQMKDRLEAMKKKNQKKKDEWDIPVDYEEVIKAKDEETERQKEERKRKRKERKKLAKEQAAAAAAKAEEQPEEDAINPDMAAMMGFSNFG